jgi:glucokinase
MVNKGMKMGMHREDDWVLGIDLGGTKILTAVVDRQGHLLGRDHSVTPAAFGPEAVLSAIEQSAVRALGQSQKTITQMTAIGIGAPGPSNPQTGIIFTSPNLPGWQEVPIHQVLADRFSQPVFLINDANAAALAEHRFGAGKGTRNMIYLTISTGIGGGLILDNRLYTGSIGTAGELGHMTIQADGPQCNCGNTGCWEALASGTALAREARLKAKQGQAVLIKRMVQGDLQKITAITVQEAAEQGDVQARELIGRTAYFLGVGLANLLNIFNPELFVIGGGLTNLGPAFLASAYESARDRAYRVAFDAARFKPPLLGRDSGVLGAAAYAFDRVR